MLLRGRSSPRRTMRQRSTSGSETSWKTRRPQIPRRSREPVIIPPQLRRPRARAPVPERSSGWSPNVRAAAESTGKPAVTFRNAFVDALLLEGTARNKLPIGVALLDVSFRVMSPKGLRKDIGVEVESSVNDLPLVRFDVDNAALRYCEGAVAAVLGRIFSGFAHESGALFLRNTLPRRSLPFEHVLGRTLHRLAIVEVSDR